jgi:hypothetical protein
MVNTATSSRDASRASAGERKATVLLTLLLHCRNTSSMSAAWR